MLALFLKHKSDDKIIQDQTLESLNLFDTLMVLSTTEWTWTLDPFLSTNLEMIHILKSCAAAYHDPARAPKSCLQFQQNLSFSLRNEPQDGHFFPTSVPQLPQNKEFG